MTATATIQVAFIDPPEAGKRKKGRIKTTTGETYSVEPIDVGKFQPGQFYDVTIEPYTWQGKQYHSIKGNSIKPRPPEKPQVVTGAATQGPGQTTPAPTFEDREFEFVTRVLCARVSIGGMTPKDLVDGGVMLRQAYAAIFGTGARA